VASNDRQFDGEGGTERPSGADERREPEFDVRDPDLWDELGLERSDDLPVPAASSASADERNARSRGARPAEDRLTRPTVMALLSHLSVLFGVPVFLAPFLLRRDGHSLHHAKAAAVVFFAFYALLGAALFGWPALTPAAMLLYAPGLVGIYRAVQGRRAGFFGFGVFGEWLFPWPETP